MATTHEPAQFALQSRILHWVMAAMLLAMLFIGVSMVASLSDYSRLLAIHRPLGILILVFAVVRLVNRKLTTLPPFPASMSHHERRIASASEKVLYTLMIVLPLVGWSMLSAGHFPIVMLGSLHLPPILPVNPMLYTVLRKTHTILAYALFLTFLAHLSAVLFHTLIVRDRLLDRMALWPVRLKSPPTLDHQSEKIAKLKTQLSESNLMDMQQPNGFISRPSKHSVDDTVARVEQLLQAKGVNLFAKVDHSGEAAKVGMPMRPTKLLIFGSPKTGTPLMIAAPSIAIDLPLKLLIWEDGTGKVWISFNSAEYLRDRHHLPPELIQNIAVVSVLAERAAE